ncbi:MAG: ABC transporter ATP-binding protein [Burkholderiaceae bacterium]
MSPGPPARLSLRGIGKVYPGTIANRDIDLEVAAGEIHAVLGENGAGKSTLMKIAYGVTQPSSGEIRWEGEPVVLRDPAHARSLGIGMVFQHFSLFESLTVVENAALALPGRPDLADLARRIEAIGLRYGLPVDPGRRVLALSIGERQRVEIIRCLLQNPRLLIMDEPTSVLTPDAVRRLFEVLRQLAAQGCSILYISHKLEEIRELCHRATVLRGGQVTGRCVPAEESAASLARMMIGEAPLQVRRDAGRVPVGEVRLQLAGLSLPSEDPYGVALHDIDLEVRAGEIVGIAGISGNGQQELLRAISGETLVEDDVAIRLFGQPAGRAPVARRRARGMGLVPEERLGRGAVPQMNLAENALLTAHRQGLCRAGFIDFAAARRFAAGCIERFGVKASGPQAQASALSGGNLQKFIVAREIAQQPGLLVAAQPTWGVDVGAAVFLRGQLMALRDRGAAVLVVSEELDELFEICDRIAVLAAGRLSSARPLAECRREAIGRLMGGAMADDAVAHCAS